MVLVPRDGLLLGQGLGQTVQLDLGKRERSSATLSCDVGRRRREPYNPRRQPEEVEREPPLSSSFAVSRPWQGRAADCPEVMARIGSS